MITNDKQNKVLRFAVALLLSQMIEKESLGLSVLVQANKLADLGDENVLHGLREDDLLELLTLLDDSGNTPDDFDAQWTRITLGHPSPELLPKEIKEICRKAYTLSGKRVRDALLEFVTDIEAVGGVCYNDDNSNWELKNEDWPDLADTYIRACAVLKRQAQVDESESQAPKCPHCYSFQVGHLDDKCITCGKAI